MGKLTLSIIFLFLLTLALPACQKTEGIGGASQIEGKVRYIKRNSRGDSVATYYAPDQKVYIIYGNNTLYDDDMNTNFDGRFRFNYLQKGKYTLYAYSECDTCLSKKKPVFTRIEVYKKGFTYTASEIVLNNY